MNYYLDGIPVGLGLRKTANEVMQNYNNNSNNSKGNALYGIGSLAVGGATAGALAVPKLYNNFVNNEYNKLKPLLQESSDLNLRGMGFKRGLPRMTEADFMRRNELNTLLKPKREYLNTLHTNRNALNNFSKKWSSRIGGIGGAVSMGLAGKYLYDKFKD